MCSFTWRYSMYDDLGYSHGKYCCILLFRFQLQVELSRGLQVEVIDCSPASFSEMAGSGGD